MRLIVEVTWDVGLEKRDTRRHKIRRDAWGEILLLHEDIGSVAVNRFDKLKQKNSKGVGSLSESTPFLVEPLVLRMLILNPLQITGELRASDRSRNAVDGERSVAGQRELNFSRRQVVDFA